MEKFKILDVVKMAREDSERSNMFKIGSILIITEISDDWYECYGIDKCNQKDKWLVSKDCIEPTNFKLTIMEEI